MTPIENKLKEEGLRDGKHPALTMWINYFKKGMKLKYWERTREEKSLQTEETDLESESLKKV